MRNKYRSCIRSVDAFAVLPKGGCECRNAIKDICPALSIGEPKEEPTKVHPLLLGLLDELRVLKVAKVLRPQSRLFSGKQHVAGNMMLQFVVRLLGPSVRADVKHDGRIADDALDGSTRPPGLELAFVREWDLPIRQAGEEGFVFVSKRSTMSQEQYLLREAGSYFVSRRGRVRRRECRRAQ